MTAHDPYFSLVNFIVESNGEQSRRSSTGPPQQYPHVLHLPIITYLELSSCEMVKMSTVGKLDAEW